MRLPPEGARWFVHVRWIACALVFLLTSIGGMAGVLPDPRPQFLIGAGMLAYNAVFWWWQRSWGATQQNVDRHIAAQILCDILALSCLMYFSDLPRNPFLVYYALPMIIAGMYLRGPAPIGFGILVTLIVGVVIGLEYLTLLPRFPVRYSPGPPAPLGGVYLLTLFIALSSSLWIALYFAISIRRYVDRAHEEIRQKEKMVGIGQLVASIGHEIANPLDGVQNCLRRIGDHVKDDPHLTEYVKMMEEALDRIEKTTKRVQSFARPRGIQLQPTSVNAAVETTLQLIGSRRADEIVVETALTDAPLVLGDPYTLQEVLFNLCMNAIAAMPGGGKLALRTYVLGPHDEAPGHVAIDVSDTGSGIAPGQLERVFEPFYTTRAESGGTGLGLALCRMLTAEMDGRIQVHSTLNVGTTFTIILQRADAVIRQKSE
ncbi:MAG: ATP-binding protein [Planctomycetes bacterium]|nr:ATP-binding protein [Planctomycetota bacterium]